MNNEIVEFVSNIRKYKKIYPRLTKRLLESGDVTSPRSIKNEMLFDWIYQEYDTAVYLDKIKPVKGYIAKLEAGLKYSEEKRSKKENTYG